MPSITRIKQKFMSKAILKPHHLVIIRCHWWSKFVFWLKLIFRKYFKESKENIIRKVSNTVKELVPNLLSHYSLFLSILYVSPAFLLLSFSYFLSSNLHFSKHFSFSSISSLVTASKCFVWVCVCVWNKFFYFHSLCTILRQ